jgi:hypothetical protein
MAPELMGGTAEAQESFDEIEAARVIFVNYGIGVTSGAMVASSPSRKHIIKIREGG